VRCLHSSNVQPSPVSSSTSSGCVRPRGSGREAGKCSKMNDCWGRAARRSSGEGQRVRQEPRPAEKSCETHIDVQVIRVGRLTGHGGAEHVLLAVVAHACCGVRVVLEEVVRAQDAR
jgi:hypothetical protein